MNYDPRLTPAERALERKKSKRLALKLYCIAKKGYKCSVCGEKHNAYSMSFHHTGEEEKDTDLTKIIHKMRDKKINNDDFKTLHNELDKTILVCEVCHQRLHEFKNYTADTYHNALKYLSKINQFDLTKGFEFDKKEFKDMYKSIDNRGECDEQGSKSSGSAKPKRALKPTVKSGKL